MNFLTTEKRRSELDIQYLKKTNKQKQKETLILQSATNIKFQLCCRFNLTVLL